MAPPKETKLTVTGQSIYKEKKEHKEELNEAELAKKIAVKLYDAINFVTSVFNELQKVCQDKTTDYDDTATRIIGLQDKLAAADRKLSEAVELYHTSKAGIDLVYYYYDLPERLRELHRQSETVNHMIASRTLLKHYLEPTNTDILKEIIESLDPSEQKPRNQP